MVLHPPLARTRIQKTMIPTDSWSASPAHLPRKNLSPRLSPRHSTGITVTTTTDAALSPPSHRLPFPHLPAQAPAKCWQTAAAAPSSHRPVTTAATPTAMPMERPIFTAVVIRLSRRSRRHRPCRRNRNTSPTDDSGCFSWMVAAAEMAWRMAMVMERLDIKRLIASRVQPRFPCPSRRLARIFIENRLLEHLKVRSNILDINPTFYDHSKLIYRHLSASKTLVRTFVRLIDRLIDCIHLLMFGRFIDCLIDWLIDFILSFDHLSSHDLFIDKKFYMFKFWLGNSLLTL